MKEKWKIVAEVDLEFNITLKETQHTRGCLKTMSIMDGESLPLIKGSLRMGTNMGGEFLTINKKIFAMKGIGRMDTSME